MTKVGIREVAKASGVSVSTVSRAFTRPDLVSDKTRRKVLETADRLDFNISRSATALKSGLTYRAAMLMNEDITSWFNNRVLAGLDDVMHGAGYDISLFQHIDTAENRERFFTTLPVRRNVDAVFVASFAVDSREVEQLKRIRVPIVGINTPGREDFDATVCIDDDEGMMMLRSISSISVTNTSCTSARAPPIRLMPLSMLVVRVSSMLVRPLRQATTCTGRCLKCRAMVATPTVPWPRCWRLINSRMQSVVKPTPLRFR